MIKLWTTGLLVGGAMMASSMSSHASDTQEAMGWAHPNVTTEEAAPASTAKHAEVAPAESPASVAEAPAAEAPAPAAHHSMGSLFLGHPAAVEEGKEMAHHDMTSFHHSIHWGYTGIGAPQYWGDLKEDYVLCKEGHQQSPIDISSATIASLPAIKVDYKSTPLDILNNGHAIQVNYSAGSSISVAGKKYNLLQFHFHSPSEHTIGGKAHDMVAHLVHKADDGQLAVIGIMIDGGGPENPFISKLWSAFPSASGDHNTPEGVEINVAGLLPKDLNHFNYSGSLTTPPCSEGVNWFVLSAPVQVSDAQLQQFRNSIFHDARPVQPVNGRVVRLGN